MARAAVYNRFWSTAGGGEKFAGGIAEVLSRVHDVTLLTPEPFDVAALAEHLQLDLSATTLRVIQSEPNAATAASADYDIFVNPSFASDAVNLARKGLYVVHFADLDPPQPPVQGRLLTPRKWFGHLSDASIKGLPPRPTWAGGVYGTERHGRLPYRWTNGQARLAVPHGPSRCLVIALVGLQTAEVGPRTVTVHGIGLTPATTTVPPRRAEGNKQLQPLRLIRVTVPASPTATILHIDSEGWAALGDNRTLGVALAGVWEAGSGSAASLAGALRRRVVPWSAATDFLNSYDDIVANSDFTRQWVARRWNVDCSVLYPPVTAQPRAAKAKIILGVGRFFDPSVGSHSKKQLELVDAFEQLHRGGTNDWELHLAGGCDAASRGYADEVQRRAGALPLQLHLNASADELRNLYATASLFWHGTGLGEDPARHPERFEHFGISTVEAMSAGAVPLTLGEGGQAELFEHGVEGFHYRNVAELVAYTQNLIADPARRERMGHQAQQRAARFDFEQFATALLGIVGRPG